MEKRAIYFILLLFIASPSFAQFRAGVKAGANMSNITMNMSGVELEIYEPRAGFHAGLMAEYMFSRYFGLHSELVYVYSGATIDPEKYLQGLELPEGTSIEGYVSMHTLQLPLYAIINALNICVLTIIAVSLWKKRHEEIIYREQRIGHIRDSGLFSKE